MIWKKKGLIFEPQGNLDWMFSHAMTPFADRIGEDIFRVYFCGRDKKGRCHIGCFDLDMNQPQKNLHLHNRPIISLGPLGSFDDSGVNGPWIVDFNGKKYHYYVGWTLGITVPFYFYIGLAISEDGGQTFHKVSLSPILDRNPIDPYLTGSPCVLIENNIWRMWYISGTGWELENNQPKHYYHIKYAESADGIYWDRKGIVCIDYQSPHEYALARPCVLKEDNLYKMWYSYRGPSYRMGYAESKDGIAWERKDEAVGIDVSESGWDSEMIEYPFIFDHAGERYMLYNGNGYGKTVIGLAQLEREK